MEIKQQIAAIIEKIRPNLQMDGGDIEFVDYLDAEKVVLVRLQGACSGCPMSTFTVKGFVEQTIKAEIPEVAEVRVAP
jgi:Fe-S cluster biogenesis protein NfuA